MDLAKDFKQKLTKLLIYKDDQVLKLVYFLYPVSSKITNLLVN